MNEEMHNGRTADPLSRWWWPGQWLRIVYGVWVDQVWYWQNVRPLLHNIKTRIKIFIQSLFGSVLVAAALSTVLGGILDLVGVSVDWAKLISQSAITVVFFGGLLGMFFRITACVGIALPVGVVIEVMRIVPSGTAKDLIGSMFSGLVIGMGVVVAYGADKRDVKSYTRKDLLLLTPVLAIFISTFISWDQNSSLGLFTAVQKNLHIGIAGALGGIMGACLSAKWVIRQTQGA